MASATGSARADAALAPCQQTHTSRGRPLHIRALGSAHGRRQQPADDTLVLIYRGAEIGVVERIEPDGPDGEDQLHVRGGISGGLAYLVPARVIVTVDQRGRRAEVDATVTFVPDPIEGDGLVWLSARVDRSPSIAPGGELVGARVRAADGPLGVVESVSYSDAGTLHSVVVRGRRHLRTRRFEIPAELLRPADRARSELAVDGERRELRTR